MIKINFKLALIAILILALVSPVLFAQTKLIEKVEKKGTEIVIPYEKYELPNGLTLIIHQDNSDPIVYVDVTYHVGSAREIPGRSGFAHFFEHMMFQGSDNVADEEHFKIVSEGAVAAGIRRIGAITSDATKDFYFENNRVFYEIKDLLKNPVNPQKAIIDLQEENVSLRKQIEHLLKDKAKNLKGDLINEIESINGINFLAKKLDLDQNSIKDLAFEIGNQVGNLFLIAGSETDGKAFLTCYISKNLVEEKTLNAGTVVRELGKLIQGGGGGQPFFATAGGKNPAGIAEALLKGKEYIL